MILEVGCGEGYGTKLLSENAEKIIGTVIGEKKDVNSKSFLEKYSITDFYIDEKEIENSIDLMAICKK